MTTYRDIEVFNDQYCDMFFPNEFIDFDELFPLSDDMVYDDEPRVEEETRVLPSIEVKSHFLLDARSTYSFY